MTSSKKPTYHSRPKVWMRLEGNTIGELHFYSIHELDAIVQRAKEMEESGSWQGLHLMFVCPDRFIPVIQGQKAKKPKKSKE